MALGLHIHPWAKLRTELALLASRTHGTDACVLDAWGNIWCVGIATETTMPFERIQTALDYLATLKPPLQRGGRLDGALDVQNSHMYARSFASVYVILIIFAGPFSLSFVRKTVQAAAPKIEVLTLALPPPDGPMSGGAAGGGIA